MAAEQETNDKSQSKTPMHLTWEDSEALSRFTTETGKILPRKYTRLSAREQRHITRTIKHARNLLLMK